MAGPQMTDGKPSLETGMLAFARSLQITEGVFYGTKSTEPGADPVPIEIITKGVRGQSSEDEAKNPGLSNPQSVEFAAVPQGCDGIEIRFSVRVLPNAMQPHACDKTDVYVSYERLAKGYAKAGGFQVVGALYAWNIANGRFAWRNRWQTDDAEVRVEFEGRLLVFDPFALGLEKPDGMDELVAALRTGSREDLERFVGRFGEALERDRFYFSVVWVARMEPGQEVFPSQEYVRASQAESDLSRVYAGLSVAYRGGTIRQASLHSQKIGAALRHVDIWHGSDLNEAIAVNPYGGVQATSAVLRNKGSKKSFYELRKNAAKLIGNVEVTQQASGISDDVHFVMANLVRGGVFGSSRKND